MLFRRIALYIAVICICFVQSAYVFAAHARALTKEDIRALLKAGVYPDRVAQLVRERGIAFPLTPAALGYLRDAGAGEGLLDAIESTQGTGNAAAVSPAARKRRANQTKTISSGILSKAPAAAPNLPKAQSIGAVQPGIAPGTRITINNWFEYRDFMPVGMIRMFEGRDFWKMPPDAEMEVVPTVLEPLPAGYTNATRRYADRVRVVHLPDGRNDVKNYVGGEPFPNPQEPDKGYKLLVDLWFAYAPHLIAGTPNNPLKTCTQDRFGDISCVKLLYVYRQTAYNTDPGVPWQERDASDSWYTEWVAIEVPEQSKYFSELTLFPRKNQLEEELYLFVPQLRTSLRGSLAARCSPVAGTDYTLDDYRTVGFNGGISKFTAEFLGHRRILAITGRYDALAGKFPASYYMPLGWPRPSWAKWQVRDVDVISVSRVNSEKQGYCFAQRVIYEDSRTHYALWEDAYDARMRLWKSALVAPRLVKASVLGEVLGAVTSSVWDFKSQHMTNGSTEDEYGHDLFADYDVPTRYNDLAAFATPAGLREILK